MTEEVIDDGGIKVEANGHIDLDKDTQNDLRELFRGINELQSRMQLMVRTYVKAKGKDGNYAISKDLTKLEPVKQDE